MGIWKRREDKLLSLITNLSVTVAELQETVAEMRRENEERRVEAEEDARAQREFQEGLNALMNFSIGGSANEE